MEIRPVRPEEFYELRALLDTVFSKHNGHEASFARLFPRLFGQENAFVTRSTLGAFENGSLIGTAALYPLDYRVGGVRVRLVANGNVAVREDCRGRGVMSALLQEVNRACDEIADLCYLHGDPVRYGRFGYVPCGREYLLVFAPKPAPVCFAPMTDSDAAPYNALAQKHIDFIVRPEGEVIDAMRAGYREALAVRNEKNAFIGGLSFNEKTGFIEEFALEDGCEAAVFAALAHTAKKPVTVRLSGYEHALLDRLSPLAAEVKESIPALFRIVRPDVIRAAAEASGAGVDALYAPYLT